MIQTNLAQEFPLFAWTALQQQFPGWMTDGAPEALSGGLLNYVWRVRGISSGTSRSVIVKWAPDHIPSAPDVWLDPNRIRIEARAMALFTNCPDNIRPPRLYHLDESNHLLVMEDIGHSPDLGAWLTAPHSISETQAIGVTLGKFIGSLHVTSANQPKLASAFDNHTIQHTRLEFHYGNVQTYAQRAGLADAVELGERAVWLGERLQQPGVCLIMGDLWLPSIQVTNSGLRIIDWELAHYGYPSQDIGHLTAHLWMLAHRVLQPYIAKNAVILLDAFLRTYRQVLGAQFDILFGAEGVRESSIHFGSEIFARAVGAFQNDYSYRGLEPAHPIVQKAVQTAAAHICTPLEMQTFDSLDWRMK